MSKLDDWKLWPPQAILEIERLRIEIEKRDSVIAELSVRLMRLNREAENNFTHGLSSNSTEGLEIECDKRSENNERNAKN